MPDTSSRFHQFDPKAYARLRWQLSALRVSVKLLRLMRATQKAGFDPNQPRVPAGNPDGGRWTDDTRWAETEDPAPRASQSQSPDPAPDSPEHVPPSVDIIENMREASRNKDDLLWFYLQVNTGSVWDFKPYGIEYEDFGNFHYGAVGRAAGISEAILMRAAGWAHVRDNPQSPTQGKVPTLPEILLGLGGEPPFGDDPNDQYWISLGYRFAEAYFRSGGGGGF